MSEEKANEQAKRAELYSELCLSVGVLSGGRHYGCALAVCEVMKRLYGEAAVRDLEPYVKAFRRMAQKERNE